MKLFVDVGNTAMKWRFRHGEKVEQGGLSTRARLARCRGKWPVSLEEQPQHS